MELPISELWGRLWEGQDFGGEIRTDLLTVSAACMWMDAHRMSVVAFYASNLGKQPSCALSSCRLSPGLVSLYLSSILLLPVWCSLRREKLLLTALYPYSLQWPCLSSLSNVCPMYSTLQRD